MTASIYTMPPPPVAPIQAPAQTSIAPPPAPNFTPAAPQPAPLPPSGAATPAASMHAVTAPAISHHVAHPLLWGMGPHGLFLGMLVLVLLFVLLWMPATRDLLKGFFGTLVIPVFSAMVVLIFRRMSKMTIVIVESHKIFLINLFSSHKKIFPDLQDEE
ncbi:MAG: hypothetical protein M1492_08125 [Gammaproteobacteria bacterium]|uniref:hypothetical protein n=1 Tax=Acidithiobacillus ferrooxidans TaxID=920 RepID=UPI0021495566|nr:hypothetical protein [Acidithiobacillus ferrooxidans]MCL4526446.1 hypothetical protein [Gammaproteobacteria bacterium]MCR1345302.1 hypothetical protein [Acidithiobacillus ferrooxidans]MCR1354462.1 hypothetical protein [Acidithiobacillus ferrooxidans]